jgi:hypothetical protein
MYAQVHNEKMVKFIKEKNQETDYMVSNCAGAQLIGVSGIADGKKIVTWIGGGKQLQIDYPNLISSKRFADYFCRRWQVSFFKWEFSQLHFLFRVIRKINLGRT